MDVNRPTPLVPGTSRFAPWAALFAALSGELLHHQVLSDMLRYDCRLGDGRLFLLAGIGVMAWMALGAVVSWHAVRGGDRAEGRSGARRFIAHLGLLAAALLAIAVAWQTFAGFVVPACGT
jgi:hypothetical protein